MQIKIIFDSSAIDKRFATGWGFSCLIDERILFDAGEKPLSKNIESAGAKVSDIKSVVISHDHWDHTGGLWELLELNPRIKVYACPKFSRKFKEKVRFYGSELFEVDKFTKIEENIYLTGEIAGRYGFRYMPEQALVLRTQNGLTIITGCAHPGIIKIIKEVKRNLPGDIYLVLGGFHLAFSSSRQLRSIIKKFRELKVRKAAPTHCTGESQIKSFQEEYQSDFFKIAAGMELEV
ncbi:MBL fold metallo-hydrolase [Candidatus Omnitrophota bacterium]